MCFVVVVLLNVKPAYKLDMPAGGAGWRAAEMLVVFPQLFVMVGLAEGIAGWEVDSPGEGPLPLGDRTARARRLVVGN